MDVLTRLKQELHVDNHGFDSYTPAFIKEMIDNKDKDINVAGVTIDQGRWLLTAILLLPWVKRLEVKQLLSLLKTHKEGVFVHPHEDFLTSTQQRIQNIVWKEIRHSVPLQILNVELANVINVMYNVIVQYIQKDYLTLNGIHLVELGDLIKESATKEDLKTESNLKVIEQEMKGRGKALVDNVLAVKENPIKPWATLGISSPAQLSQTLFGVGFRTDVNDQMIAWPVTDSYINGIQDIKTFAVESRSGAKSKLWNAVMLGMNQYNNRQVQLVASILERVYHEDCGATALIPFVVTDENYTELEGINYKLEDESSEPLRQINGSSDAKQYLGKTLYLRTALTCRHTNGVCSVCGGAIMETVHDRMNVGIMAATTVISIVSQKILSNKHLAQTNMSVYTLPGVLSRFFEVNQNEVFVRTDVRRNNLQLHFDIRDVVRIQDLLRGNKYLDEKHFSNISSMSIWDNARQDWVLPQVDMKHEDVFPHLSRRILELIIEDPSIFTFTDKIGALHIDKLPKRDPIFVVPNANLSTIAFAKSIQNFTKKEAEKYTDLEFILKDFTNLLYSQISANLTYSCIILRALMIQEQNHLLPIVDDIHNVRFGKLADVIAGRTIGGQLAHQSQLSWVRNPRSYVTPKVRSPFDVLMNI